jgi:hypothetical protein
MAFLCETSTGRLLPLQAEHVIGRAPVCALQLLPRYISAQHARVRWTGTHWEIKDLGSLNGTFVQGARIPSGRAHALARGAQIAFGTLEQSWELRDDSPPVSMAVPLDGGEPVLMEADLMALPSSDDPRTTIYRDAGGTWLLEHPDESTSTLENLALFEAADRWWRFCCPDQPPSTALTGTSLAMSVRDVELSFVVSRDEEHVHLRLLFNGKSFDLGARARNYLLLTLARRRLAEHREGLPDEECGWVSLDDCPHDPMLAPQQVNLDVFRTRKQLAKLGVVDAATIVERRPLTRQLRIGTSRIAIEGEERDRARPR